MNEQLQQTISDVLKKMAENLGVATEYLWGVLVKGMFAQGIADVVLAVAFFIVAVLAWKVGWGKANAMEGGHPGTDAQAAKNAVGLIASGGACVLVGLGLFFGYWGVIEIVAPEYAALRTVLSAVSDGIKKP